MSFVRPEARAALWRWREVLASLAILLTGLWWAIGGNGILQWIGWVIFAVAVLLIAAGIQRGRFRGPAGGPGVVRVDEGQIAYFGPLTGGAVALSELVGVVYDAAGTPAHWVLTQPGQPDLYIPENAEGVDALFDTFASLPGLRTERLLKAKQTPEHTTVKIWRRPGAPDNPSRDGIEQI